MALTNEQKEEVKKCKKDPIYFIENYVYIETEDYGVIKFKLYEYQKKLIREILADDYQLHHWRKSRQIGCSTLLSAYAVWLTNFYMAKSVAIVATDLRTAKKLHGKASYAWSRLPEWMRMGKNNRNMTQLFLKNRSSIEAFPFSKDKGTRSISASLVIMDECAFMNNAEDVWGAIEPSLSKSGNVIALSSPDAPQGWFYNVFNEEKTNDHGEWNLVKLSWEVHPERDQAWRDEKDRRVGKRKAKREYDAEFGVSKSAYFEPEYIEKIKDYMIKDPIIKKGKLWIWEEPIEGEEYLIVVDPAEGSHDLSAIEVFKLSTMEQVAEYLERIHYNKFNVIPTKIAKQYNNGLLVIEDNSIGKTTISRTKDLNYLNLFKRGQNKKERQILGITNPKDGWNTNTKTRPMIIESLRSFIETDEGFITIRSERLLQQLMTFIEKNNKPQAQSGSYDDGIMATAIGCFVYEIRGTRIKNPDTEHDILEMYSAIQESAQDKYKAMKEFDDLFDGLTEEEKDKEILKKKRKDIINSKGKEFNMGDPFMESYIQNYKDEFGF